MSIESWGIFHDFVWNFQTKSWSMVISNVGCYFITSANYLINSFQSDSQFSNSYLQKFEFQSLKNNSSCIFSLFHSNSLLWTYEWRNEYGLSFVSIVWTLPREDQTDFTSRGTKNPQNSKTIPCHVSAYVKCNFVSRF